MADAAAPTLRGAVAAGAVVLPDGVRCVDGGRAAPPAGDDSDSLVFAAACGGRVRVTYDRAAGLFFLAEEGDGNAGAEGFGAAVQAAQEFAFTLEGARPRDAAKVLARLARALSSGDDAMSVDGGGSDSDGGLLDGSDDDGGDCSDDGLLDGDSDEDDAAAEDLDENLKHSLRVKRRCMERDRRVKEDAAAGADAAGAGAPADGKAGDAAADRKGVDKKGKGKGGADAKGEDLDERARVANQIFSADEATSLLLSEIEAAICASREKFWFINTVDDDAAHWRAELFFPLYDHDGNEVDGDARRIAGQLQQVQALHGAASSVEVEVSFHRDLYPFYPPSIRLVRPRFGDFMLDRLAALSSLWHPCKRVGDLLDEVRLTLLKGNIDVECAMNNSARHPGGAYPQAAYALCELGRASQTPPRVQLLRPELFPSDSDRAAANATGAGAGGKRKAGEEDAQRKGNKKAWAKGTGYGFDNAAPGHGSSGEVWDVKSYERAEQRRLEETNRLLLQLLNDLRKRGAGGDLSTEGALLSYCPSEDHLADGVDAALSDSLAMSVLSPFTVRSLASASWLEMGKHPRMYATLLAVVRLLACSPLTAKCIFVDARCSAATGAAPPGAPGGGGAGCATQSIADVLSLNARSAQLFLKTLGETGSGLGDRESIEDACRQAKCVGAPTELDGPLARCVIVTHQAVMGVEEAARAEHMEALAADVPTTPPAAKAPAGGDAGAGGSGGGGARAAAGAGRRGGGRKGKGKEPPAATTPSAAQQQQDAAAAHAEAEKSYAAAVSDFVFDSCELVNVPSAQAPHHYATNSSCKVSAGKTGSGGPIGSSSRERMKRLAHDAVTLQNSLPVSRSSTIMVALDDARPDLLRAVITGPEDTPYSCGAFVFDVGFPARYPDVPPTVNLQTTGRGSVRFNPNLYNCGKVCLSLLGTWQGAEGETWSKAGSTLLQVFVSVQSLIFVPEPYFNEPGYEGIMGTPNGDIKSRAYNDQIRVATVKWAIIDALEKPMAGTEAFVRAHFKAKRDEVLRTVGEWVDDAKERAELESGGAAGGGADAAAGLADDRIVRRSESASEVHAKLEAMMPKLKKLLAALD